MKSFDWDGPKSRANERKHGVMFEDARSVFFDEEAIEVYDREKDGEDRYMLTGRSERGQVLAVCFCLRHWGKTIRIISARKASMSERAEYMEML